MGKGKRGKARSFFGLRMLSLQVPEFAVELLCSSLCHAASCLLQARLPNEAPIKSKFQPVTFKTKPKQKAAALSIPVPLAGRRTRPSRIPHPFPRRMRRTRQNCDA